MQRKLFELPISNHLNECTPTTTVLLNERRFGGNWFCEIDEFKQFSWIRAYEGCRTLNKVVIHNMWMRVHICLAAAERIQTIHSENRGRTSIGVHTVYISASIAAMSLIIHARLRSHPPSNVNITFEWDVIFTAVHFLIERDVKVNASCDPFFFLLLLSVFLLFNILSHYNIKIIWCWIAQFEFEFHKFHRSRIDKISLYWKIKWKNYKVMEATHVIPTISHVVRWSYILYNSNARCIGVSICHTAGLRGPNVRQRPRLMDRKYHRNLYDSSYRPFCKLDVGKWLFGIMWSAPNDVTWPPLHTSMSIL